MFDVVLTPAERAFLEALDALGIRCLVVDMSAALIEGAPVTTQDLDLWLEALDDQQLGEAAHRAGGFYTSGLGLQPPAVGGTGLDRIDLILTASGLDSFDDEYAQAREYEVGGVRIAVLPLERVIASKLAARRPKDLAQMPILEATLAARKAREGGGE